MKAKRSGHEQLRKTLRSIVPKAEECISYRIPALRLDGRMLVYFGAASKHCAIYGLSEVDAGDLDDYDTRGRGTIRFQPDKPLPTTLLRKLVKARIAKNDARTARAKRKR
jgi:uncharacterized protein YdhG (YjbR/CyaY superfamily)